jgi:hypothetical protein
MAAPALRLYGHTSEEIGRMIDDGVIARPQRWNRYYASLNAVRQPDSMDSAFRYIWPES